MLLPDKKKRQKMAEDRARLQRQADAMQRALQEKQAQEAKQQGGCGCNKKT
jgi:hypothetical protein